MRCVLCELLAAQADALASSVRLIVALHKASERTRESPPLHWPQRSIPTGQEEDV